MNLWLIINKLTDYQLNPKSIIFQVLRQIGLAYIYVFLITAALYLIGVLMYYLLIIDYEKKLKAGKLSE